MAIKHGLLENCQFIDDFPGFLHLLWLFQQATFDWQRELIPASNSVSPSTRPMSLWQRLDKPYDRARFRDIKIMIYFGLENYDSDMMHDDWWFSFLNILEL